MLYLIKSGVTDSTKGLCKHLLAGQTHKYFKEYMPTIAVSTFLCYGKT
jgi:hypothetical protein